MSAALFGIPEGRARTFGRRMYRMLEDLDADAWRSVLPALCSVHARPFIGLRGDLSLPPQPLCDFEYHCPPTHDHPKLTQDVVPSGELRDLEWLLTQLLFQTCHTHTRLLTEHLAYVWHDQLARIDLSRAEPGKTAFEELSTALFRHVAKPPEDLWFLQAASHLQSYVPPNAVAALSDREEDGGFLTLLAARHENSDLGRDLRRLRHFLGLASANGEAVFLCYGVD